MNLAELTRTELAEAAGATVAVLPLGSHEQHGEHLPMGTDSLLVDAVLDAALAEAEMAAQVMRCPTLTYGFSGHHQFAAAASLTPMTLLAVLGDLLDSLVQMGFRRILLINGHGGNQEMMQQAVKLAALRLPIVAGCASYWQLTGADPGGPGHAGEFETGLMLAVRPELVSGTGAGPAEPPLFDQRLVPGLQVERQGEWARSGGTTDSSERASARAGRATLERAAVGVRDAIDALRGLELPTIRTGGDAR